MSLLNLYFRKNLDDLNKQFVREAIRGNTEEAKRLTLEDPNVVNYQDEATGLTGLMIFAADGCYSMVDHICAMPIADVGLADNFDRSAGLMAYTVGRVDIHDRIMKRLFEDIAEFDPDFAETQSMDSRNVVLFPKPDGRSDPNP